MRYLLAILTLASALLGQSHPANKCGFANSSMALAKMASPQSRDLDFLDESILSPSGNFKIHFTRTGNHAVVGSEQAGIPDFVQEAALAADSAYSLLVDELGFLPPRSDGGIDGDELDIYIKNWGGAFYGMTYFGNSAPSPTYLVIDNDYVESNYSTTGLAALRVTIAHEFFHMVQLRYAYPFENSDEWSNAYWYEISSTWMEEKCYPEVNDYHAYVADNFRQSSFPDLNDTRYGYAFSYGHGLFGQVLDMEYGISNGKHIMLDIWESLAGHEATDNLEQVLHKPLWSSSLSDALGKYAVYNVFTGSRAISNLYYPDAPELDEVSTQNYALPLSYPINFDFFMDPLEISFRKFTIPSYSDFYIRGDQLSPDQRVLLTYHSYENGSSLKSAIGDYWTLCENVSSLDYIILPMVNGSPDTDFSYRLSFEGNTLPLENMIQTLWPNPSILRIAQPQVSVMIAEPGLVEFRIYNLLGQLVVEHSMSRSEGVKLIDLDLPENIPAGIYILQIMTNDATMSRKFTVLK